MKTLEQMSAMEKAMLLHSWFPGEIPILLDTIEGMASAVHQDLTQSYNWDNGLFPPEFRRVLLIEAQSKIKRYGKKMQHNNRLFAGQLFDGYVTFFTVYCLTAYAPALQLQNRKFAVAVDLLFSP